MKLSQLKPHTLVKVRWSDSSFVRGWHYPPYEFGKPERTIFTVGWVVESRHSILTIAPTLEEHGGILNPVFIPYGVITGIVVLKTVSKNKLEPKCESTTAPRNSGANAPSPTLSDTKPAIPAPK